MFSVILITANVILEISTDNPKVVTVICNSRRTHSGRLTKKIAIVVHICKYQPSTTHMPVEICVLLAFVLVYLEKRFFRNEMLKFFL